MTDFVLSEELSDKLSVLRGALKELTCVAVSFSGGVDSTLLLAVAHEQLGDKVLAITETNKLYPQRETEEAVSFCKSLGVEHVLFEHDCESSPAMMENPMNRCYLCKTDLFVNLRAVADAKAVEHGWIAQGQHIAIAEGSNTSDLADYRPGSKAVEEQGVLSPLLNAGLSKDDIRAISKAMGLPTWNKPSFACLASRFVYGESITNVLLDRVDAAEQLFIDAGFRQVRVRMHDKGDLARVEVPRDQVADAFAFLSSGGAQKLHELGYKHVSLDMDGYRTGSMN